MNRFKLLLVLAIVGSVSAAFSGAFAANTTNTAELDKSAATALHALTSKNPVAAEIEKKAAAVLVFPNIVKAGLIFGGAYGEGVLQQGGIANKYYNSITASFGWQAGAQSYGYVVFLMKPETVKYLNDTKGWEIGVGPSVVMVDEGVAKNLSSTSLKDDAYAFIFDQQGLMASLSIEGTKISRINNP